MNTRDIFDVALLLALGIVAGIGAAQGLLALERRSEPTSFSLSSDATATSHNLSERGLNWSQGSLKDPAADGCVGRYKVWTNVNGNSYLTGCWGDAK